MNAKRVNGMIKAHREVVLNSFYALRSALFYLWLLLSILLWLPLTYLIFIWLPLLPRYRCTTAWGRMAILALRCLCGVRYRIEGKENIPEKPCIIMANHQSAWETLLLPSLFIPQTWILKKELIEMPLFGLVLKSLHPIAIDRSQKLQAMQSIIQQGQARLQEGLWIVVFPEGTRVAAGKEGAFHLGGARLAAMTQTPILPVAHNAGLLWARNSFVKKPGVITLRIGALIAPQEDAKILNETVRTAIYTQKRQLEAEAQTS